MIVIDIRYEKDSEPAKDLPPRLMWVHTTIVNTQVARQYSATLRAGESVQHRLRLDSAGIIKLELVGE